jgi:hypothetical protein
MRRPPSCPPMKIQHIKDVILFQLSAIEMRQVMEAQGMIHSIWEHLATDRRESRGSGRWVPHQDPLKILHEEKGRGHVLQCRVHIWQYFREVDAANPLEREIRSEMLALGLSGEADRRMSRYSP